MWPTFISNLIELKNNTSSCIAKEKNTITPFSASLIAKSGVLQEQLSNGQLQTYMLFFTFI